MKSEAARRGLGGKGKRREIIARLEASEQERTAQTATAFDGDTD